MCLPRSAWHWSVSTPTLIVDLDAFERNVRKMGEFATAMGVRHRADAKTHKSVEIVRVQMDLGGACGICCQTVFPRRRR